MAQQYKNNQTTEIGLKEPKKMVNKIDHPFGFYDALTHLALEQKRQREIKRTLAARHQ